MSDKVSAREKLMQLLENGSLGSKEAVLDNIIANYLSNRQCEELLEWADEEYGWGDEEGNEEKEDEEE